MPGGVVVSDGNNASGGHAGAGSATKVVAPTPVDDDCKTNCTGVTAGSGNSNTTPIPPTATPIPSVANAPLFPETPIMNDFDPAVFISYLELVRDSFRSFNNDYVPILLDERERNRGDCGAYLGWYTLWVTRAPAFVNVPDPWVQLYYEYRVLLLNAVIVTTQIRVGCPAVDPGPYNRNQDPIGFFAAAYPRIEEMVSEAHQLQP
jgi:hypothetical protein